MSFGEGFFRYFVCAPGAGGAVGAGAGRTATTTGPDAGDEPGPAMSVRSSPVASASGRLAGRAATIGEDDRIPGAMSIVRSLTSAG